MDMKTIYVVYYDWAFNDCANEGYIGIYEDKEDAINAANQYWEDEKGMDYFSTFDECACTAMTKSAWTNGYYVSEHTCVKVYEENLYTHEDVANGLA